jgi:hypothetical protein
MPRRSHAGAVELLQLADGTETGERKGNDCAKTKTGDRVTVAGKDAANTGVSKIAAPPKRGKDEIGTAGETRAHGQCPYAAAPNTATAPTPPADSRSLPAPAVGAGDAAVTAVGRQAKVRSRNPARNTIRSCRIRSAKPEMPSSRQAEGPEAEES